MATFTSPLFPELRIQGVGRFRGGVLVVAHEEQAARVRALADRYGISEGSDAPVKRIERAAETKVPVALSLGPDAPKPTASRAAWAAYAESLGVDVDGLKRNEIIAKLEA